MEGHTGLEDFSLQNFKHHRLDDPSTQIRLLEILPGTLEDDIVCKLSTYTRPAAPKYTAISYTWGDPTPLRSISVDGKRFLVRANCFFALRQSRCLLETFHQSSFVFIDSICIDQQNPHEKSAQVAIMGDIFHAAELVFASVGVVADDSNFLFMAGNDLATHTENQTSRSEADTCSVCWGSYKARHENERNHSSHTWITTWGSESFQRLYDAFVKFCSRSYWRRLWILQEIILAREVYVLCDFQWMSFFGLTCLFHIFLELDYGQSWIRTVAEQMNLSFPYRSLWKSPISMIAQWSVSRYMTIDPAIYELNKLECLDPRDRIYGILKLVNSPNSGRSLIPDYRKDTVELASDVLDSFGRDLKFALHVQVLLRLLRVDHECARQNILTMPGRKGHRLHGGSVLPDINVTACKCRTPEKPNIRMLLETYKYASVFRGDDGYLYAGLLPKQTPGRHLRLNNQGRTEGGMISDKTYTLEDVQILQIVSDMAVKENDVLLQVTERREYSDSQPVVHDIFEFVLLRQAMTGYYEVIGHARVLGKFDMCEGGSSCPCPPGVDHLDAIDYEVKPFWLCVDPEDAVAYVLFHWNEDGKSFPRIDERASALPSTTSIPFSRLRFSSFAIEGVPDTIDWEAYIPREIQDVPTLDGQNIICATCGGLFNPAVSVTSS